MQDNKEIKPKRSRAPAKDGKTGTERLCGMLGLAARARSIICGTDLSCDSVRNGSARLVLVAENASDNTKKRITNCCTFYECECRQIPVTTSDLGNSVGKSGAVSTVALTDQNFTKGIKKLLSVAAGGTQTAAKRSSEV